MKVTLRKRGGVYQLRWFENGKDVQLSTFTTNPVKAEEIRKKTEAALRLGEKPKLPTRKRGVGPGPWMLWSDFTETYKDLWLSKLRPKTCAHVLSKLKICAGLTAAKTLGEMAERKNLESLQTTYLDSGKSRWTVKTSMDTLIAALRWAEKRGWIDRVPLIDRIKTSRLKAMKGRPITDREFQEMLDKVPEVVGKEAAASWNFLLRGYWTSALRLGELMNLSWDDDSCIVPVWLRNRHPVLRIPAEMQKNDTSEETPIPPWFEAVLAEVPHEKRTGWVFNPVSLQFRVGREPRHGRPRPEWVGRVIQKIARAAKVITYRKGGVDHYASAHDLRRSCAQRMIDAGVDERVVQNVMRHASFETTRRHYAPSRTQRDSVHLHQIIPVTDYPRTDSNR